MKRCPACRRTYRDESLRFCRVDGALLVIAATESQDTLIKLPTIEQWSPTTRSLQGPRLSQITFDEAIEEYPAWSPNGSELFFSRERAGVRRIFRKNIVTGEETQIGGGNFDEIQPTGSPEGQTTVCWR